VGTEIFDAPKGPRALARTYGDSTMVLWPPHEAKVPGDTVAGAKTLAALRSSRPGTNMQVSSVNGSFARPGNTGVVTPPISTAERGKIDTETPVLIPPSDACAMAVSRTTEASIHKIPDTSPGLDCLYARISS
jgi:hypothetical protein